MEKYRLERIGRRSFHTGLEYDTVSVNVNQETRTAKRAVRATRFGVRRLDATLFAEACFGARNARASSADLICRSAVFQQRSGDFGVFGRSSSLNQKRRGVSKGREWVLPALARRRRRAAQISALRQPAALYSIAKTACTVACCSTFLGNNLRGISFLPTIAIDVCSPEAKGQPLGLRRVLLA
jgi:hypothetical protein